ncbi:WD40 repeat-like protein [Sistotremastrum suecicum HHB10207 ss-3]|uniref:WD40 repeat-like protein n=1 Tax=Sistotremastrum suecicum HHB10207 ss-3 TaxID=1314776 RepID=A0A165ZK39_9AGAM|nr:WD40 repeat-like protein [Sistotremastrum suecicum HHB10207 ss-3]
MTTPNEKAPNESTKAKRELKIYDVHGYNLPTTPSCLGTNPHFVVTIECGGQSKSSKVSKRGSNPDWSRQSFFFDYLTGGVKFRVDTHHVLGKDEPVGEVEEVVENLASRADAAGVIKCILNLPTSTDTSETTDKPTISFKYLLGDPIEIANAEVNLGKKEWKEVQNAPTVLDKIAGPLAKAETVQSALTAVQGNAAPFLDKVDAFVKLVDNIAEVHPYAKIAWSVISAGYKILQAQHQRDNALSGLVDIMDDTYAFILESKPVFEVESQRKIAEKLVQQTTECGYFILHYAEDKEFLERTVHNIFGEADATIKGFEGRFSDLKASFQARANVHTEIVVMQTAAVTQNIAFDVNLNDMQYVGDASYLPEKACFPGTRAEIIDTITQWAVRPIQPEGASLFWLNGFAGSGKSAIAHTVANLFSSGKRLGGTYIFDASHATERRADTVFSKISRDLAGMSNDWKKALGAVVQESPELRHTPSVRRQFDELILRPAKEMTFVGPILIVIDALDECGGTPDSRKELLNILASRLPELPPNFRVLLTSRTEKEIEDAFNHRTHITQLDLQGVSHNSTSADLAIYYKMRLGQLPDLEPKWSNGAWVPALIERSEGLFQWAFTACEFVLEPGWEPVERLESLISTTELTGIDKLYRAILHHIFGFTDDDARLPRFRSVLGRVLCVRQPLSIADLTAIRGPQESASATRSIVRLMGSVLSGVSSDSSPIRALHTSFRDFLFSPERSGIYHVDASLQEELLATSCLHILNNELKFNICDLETSHSLSKDINPDDFMARLDTHIPQHLLYASRFWPIHTTNTSYTKELGALFQTFTEKQFLHWLELLGLMQDLHGAGSNMKLVRSWAKGKDRELTDFSRDAEKFISAFADVITQSPPHLYISALPFAPETSLVARRFLPQFDKTLVVKSGKQHAWTALERTFGKRGGTLTGAIYSMSFSSDGSLLISVTLTHTVTFWSPETGQALGTLPNIESEGKYPASVAISPDGKVFAIGGADGTVCLRDLRTRNLIWGPEKVDESVARTLVFTPDSKTLWVGTEAGYVGGWDVEKGTISIPVQQLHEHEDQVVAISSNGTRVAFALEKAVTAVYEREAATSNWSLRCELTGPEENANVIAFSPDGHFLVTGCEFGNLIIWDIDAKEAHGGPLVGHTSGVYGVAFSPDGTAVVSASEDTTIRLWDVQTGTQLGKPLTGAENLIFSMTFSHDGKHFATGAMDGIISLWDRTAAEARSTHAEEKRPVLFSMIVSPDGKHVLSASADKSIHVYNADTGAEVRAPLSGHESDVNRLAFSPDGKTLVSCSRDLTIRIWDAETGDSLHEPVKGHTGEIYSISFSPDGTRLVSCAHDSTLRVWDTATWEMVGKPFEGHQSAIASAMFTVDGKRVISGSLDGTLRIWDVEKCEAIGDPLQYHKMAVWAVALSTSGETVASSSFDGAIQLWNTDTLSREGYTSMQHGKDVIFSLAFTADDSRLLSAGGDHTIRLWDVKSGQLIGVPFEGHNALITWAGFFDNEQRIASASYEGIIRIWDVEDDTSDTSVQATLQREYPRMTMDGWIHSGAEPKKLLFNVPAANRSTLLWGRCKRIIGAEPAVLDFDHFEFGERWMNCRSSSTPT